MAQAGGEKRGGSGDGAEALVGIVAELAGRGEEGGEDGALLGATVGAVAARELVVDDAVAQVALGAVVGRLDVIPVEADEQLVAVPTVALLELPGLTDPDGGPRKSAGRQCARSAPCDVRTS